MTLIFPVNCFENSDSVITLAAISFASLNWKILLAGSARLFDLKLSVKSFRPVNTTLSFVPKTFLLPPENEFLPKHNLLKFIIQIIRKRVLISFRFPLSIHKLIGRSTESLITLFNLFLIVPSVIC